MLVTIKTVLTTVSNRIRDLSEFNIIFIPDVSISILFREFASRALLTELPPIERRYRYVSGHSPLDLAEFVLLAEFA